MKVLNYLLPEKLFLKYKYFVRFGKKLNLERPITFNEKMQWLKLNERTPLHTICADKYAVREYIKNTVGEEYLIPLLYHTQNVEDIRPDNLPDTPFIIKTNHDSAGSIVVKDKTNADWKKIRKRLKRKMSRNFYYAHKEWQYKHIKPAIIAEKLLLDKNGDIPEFILHCFNGKVQLIGVRIEKDCRIIYYDLNWKKLPFLWTSQKDKIHKIINNKPAVIDEMVYIAEKLVSPFSYARVDFYAIDEKIYCGEITFHHIAGFNPLVDEAMDVKLGKMIRLPHEK